MKNSQMPFSDWGATVTESSTWPCSDVESTSHSHGHVEDSVTVAPLPRFKKAIDLTDVADTLAKH